MKLCQPSLKQSNKMLHLSTFNSKLQYKLTFTDIFSFSQATTVHSIPGRNHYLIQVEYYRYSFCQRKYVNTAIRNNNDSIIALDKISNPFTADDAYPEKNLRQYRSYS